MKNSGQNRVKSLALVAGFLGVVSAGAAQAATTPLNRTKALIETFKSVEVAPEGGALTPTQKLNNQAIYKKLDDFFDYDTLINEPIKSFRPKFTSEQYKRYTTAFRELIQRLSYPRSGVYLKEAQIDFGKETIQGNTGSVALHTELESEDFENDILFSFQKEGAWRLVDVSFDGASLVTDYRNQFARIVEKDGVEGLLKKLEDRLAQERKKDGGA